MKRKLPIGQPQADLEWPPLRKSSNPPVTGLNVKEEANGFPKRIRCST